MRTKRISKNFWNDLHTNYITKLKNQGNEKTESHSLKNVGKLF